MPKLINLHDFAVRVEALGRELAPYETVVVEDEAIVRNAIATGILRSDLEDLSEADKTALASIQDVAARLAATWHVEHGHVPAEGAAQADDGRTVPFISTAQQNHVVGLAKGAAKLAEREVRQATVEGIESDLHSDPVNPAGELVESNPNPRPYAPKVGERPAFAQPNDASADTAETLADAS